MLNLWRAGDVNTPGSVEAVDVQFAINAALGLGMRGNSDVNYIRTTDAVDVQLVINAALAIVIDMDGDGLADGTEANLGTLPATFDTDGDGVGDGQELLDGTDHFSANGGEPPALADVASAIDPTVSKDVFTSTEFITRARYSQPSRVRIWVVSATHFRFGPMASK